MLENNENRFSPYFPEAEYDLRYKRARELMNKEGLSALLITDDSNYAYLGGHRRFQLYSAHRKTRPIVLILPLEDEPILIGPNAFQQAMSKGSWVKKIKTWSDLPFTVKPIRETFDELGLSRGRVGAELGLEQLLGISYNDFVELKTDMPNVEFVDASGILRKLRMTKSTMEIDVLRKACKITSAAFESLFDMVEVGMTEIQITRMMFKCMMEEGADFPNFALVRISPAGSMVAGWPTDRALKKGDYLWIDAGVVYENYRTDFSRNAVVGVPSVKHRKMHETIKRITAKCIAMVRPGVKASEIADYCDIELGKEKIPPKAMGRIGHGFGLETTELPSIAKHDHTVLEPGMAITLEPGHWTDYGYFVLEEDFVVTKKGCEVLSQDSSNELHMI